MLLLSTLTCNQACCNSLSENNNKHNVLITVNNIKQLNVNQWDTLVPNTHPFLKSSYLNAFELSHPDVSCRYVMMYKDGQLVAIAYFQIVHIYGHNNFRLTHEVVNREEDCTITHLKKWFKNQVVDRINKMEFNLLVNGNSFLTGEHGFYYDAKLLAAKTAFSLLQEAIDEIKTNEINNNGGIGAVLIKDFEPAHIADARHLTTLGYQEVKGEPNMILPMRSHWQSFADYLASMSSKYRARVKRTFKKGKALSQKSLSLTEIIDNKNKLYDLYKHVIDGVDFIMLDASADYFVQLKQQLGNNFTIRAFYLDGQMVGFISTILSAHELEAHFVGYEPQYNRQHHIYPNILYYIVQAGIDAGVQQIVFGRTAPEIKSTLGAEGVNMNCFLWHRNFLTNQLLVPLVNQFREDDWVQRHPFKEEAVNTTTKPKVKAPKKSALNT